MKDGASKEDIDFIFKNIVGGGGLWQWLFVVGFSFPIQLASTVPLLIHLFAAYEPKHRCYISGCDPNDKYWSSNDSYLKFAIPLKSASGLFGQDANPDSCSMYQLLDSTSCNPGSFDNATLDQCQMFLYDTSLFTETLTQIIKNFTQVYSSKYRQISTLTCAVCSTNLTTSPLPRGQATKN